MGSIEQAIAIEREREAARVKIINHRVARAMAELRLEVGRITAEVQKDLQFWCDPNVLCWWHGEGSHGGNRTNRPDEGKE